MGHSRVPSLKRLRTTGLIHNPPTHMISVSLMCQGRNPNVLSTGPNFNIKSGSGKPLVPTKQENKFIKSVVVKTDT